MNYIILSKAVVAAAAFTLCAQTQQSDPVFYPHNIGAGAGFSTGLGLSYRHWFKSAYGLQINLIPIVNNTKDFQNRFVSGGLTGLKILKQARMVNLFGYVGVHGMYQDWRFEEINMDGDTVRTRHKTKTFYAGFGPGFDIHFWKLSINLMAGIAGRFNDEGEYGIQMSGETALYYTF